MNVLRKRRFTVGVVILVSAGVLFCLGAIRLKTRAKTRPDQAAYKLASGPYAVETIDHARVG